MRVTINVIIYAKFGIFSMNIYCFINHFSTNMKSKIEILMLSLPTSCCSHVNAVQSCVPYFYQNDLALATNP